MPPPHPRGGHQCLGAAQPRGGILPHPREGISLTLLHCSCCRVWDRCGTEGCCTGGQRRLRGFLLSIDQPQKGPEHGRSACSKSLLLPHCPAETLKGQHSAVQPSARIRPQRRGSPDFPRLRTIPVLFSAEGPWTPRGHQGCDVTDTSWEERVSPAGRCHRDRAEHLLGMGEVLGFTPRHVQGCFRPDCPASGRCGLQFRHWSSPGPVGMCCPPRAHLRGNEGSGRAVCAASAEPLLEKKRATVLDLRSGHCPVPQTLHPPPRDNVGSRVCSFVGRAQGGERCQQHARNPFWLH